MWIANVIAALAFGAAHLPAAALLVGVSSPSQLPPLVLGEIFLINGIIGLAAGQRAMRDGLVAAMGVHFWADIVWHVVWPLLGLGW
jgi:membrane protease YdiL (CAAX protease family)